MGRPTKSSSWNKIDYLAGRGYFGRVDAPESGLTVQARQRRYVRILPQVPYEESLEREDDKGSNRAVAETREHGQR